MVDYWLSISASLHGIFHVTDHCNGYISIFQMVYYRYIFVIYCRKKDQLNANALVARWHKVVHVSFSLLAQIYIFNLNSTFLCSTLLQF